LDAAGAGRFGGHRSTPRDGALYREGGARARLRSGGSAGYLGRTAEVSVPDLQPAKAGVFSQLRQFGAVFWVSNLIEMSERLAYYGLRTVLPVYMLLAVEKGGPQFDNIQKAEIYAVWAAIQSFVPVFSGGYADRFGYRVTIAISVLLDVAGFLVMAYAQELAALMSGGASVGQPGHEAVYAAFLAGACLLALGTAVFKPGIQGLIATQITPENGSFAWSIFYQVVNIGGFVGPFLAGWMRLMTWRYVFFACAAIASTNLLWLLLVREPERERKPFALREFGMVAIRGMGGILEPRLFAFLAVFSGFWAMFYQLYDLLPNFIDDWVDSQGIYQAVAVPAFAFWGAVPPGDWAGNVPQEMMINLNAGMIMLLVSAVGYVAGRLRSMENMILGIVVSAAGILLLDTTDGWRLLLGIAVFSVGEMFASPTKMRYVADMAPPEKKALYLGYVNATVGIGWTIGSWIAGPLYEATGDKVALARRYWVEEVGQTEAFAHDLAKSEVLPQLASTLGVSVHDLTGILWTHGAPATVWWVFARIGLVSMLGMVAFDQLTRRNRPDEELWMMGLVGVVATVCYGLPYGPIFPAMMLGRWLVARALARGGPLGAEDAYKPGAVVVGLAFAGWVVYKLTIAGAGA
jgi:dipeptide/tripeptide permease